MEEEEPQQPENQPSEDAKKIAQKQSEQAPPGGKVIQQVVEDEIKDAYLSYAMSVIIGRALPDVRDGLKPVQRRILHAMNEMAMHYNKPYKKSARIVGECLGKFHPHGDQAVYDALVRMAQNFSLRYPLIDGQGNFGSVDEDNAASMRYTEARLKKIAEELLQDIDKETVLFVDNFDGSLKEPSVLPAKLPNLLINGATGIAVGMATNIPPHNVGEIVEGVITLVDKPETEILELAEIIKGPDFPTGGIIAGRQGILDAMKTGMGRIRLKAKYHQEEKLGKRRLIIDEIPYMVGKAKLIEQMADGVREKTIEGIADLRDESDREGMRIVIELKKDAVVEVVINQLFKHTRLEVTVGINMLAIVNNEPKTLSMKACLEQFILHRKDVVRKRTQFDLTKAQDKAHILEGLIIALNDIDRAITLIKQSASTQTARDMLMKTYSLSEKQAAAILDMKLQRLTSLEQDKIREEHGQLLEIIKDLKDILAKEERIKDIIKNEMRKIKEEYNDVRRTEISMSSDSDLDDEDLIKPEEVVVTRTNTGYIKRVPLETYKQQNRGGKGIIAATTKEDDCVEQLFIANTHDFLLFFSNDGKVHWLKVYKIPEATRQSKGKAIVNLLNLGEQNAKITACIPIKEFKPEQFLFMATRSGIVKKTSLEEFSRPRQGGIIAINLEENDQLVNVLLTDGSKQIMLATKSGMAVKFNEQDVRSIGRAGMGVIGIRLQGEDHVIGMIEAKEDKTILTITEHGYGKRTKTDEYRLINRGGSGVINIQTSERNGTVVAIAYVEDEDEVMLISKEGIIIRIAVKDVSIIGRNTQGVRIMKLSDGDSVVSIAKIVKES